MGLLDGLSTVVRFGYQLQTSENWVTNSRKNPEGALGSATVTSIVIKDGIGCVMYVAQSLKATRESLTKNVNSLLH